MKNFYDIEKVLNAFVDHSTSRTKHAIMTGIMSNDDSITYDDAQKAIELLVMTKYLVPDDNSSLYHVNKRYVDAIGYSDIMTSVDKKIDLEIILRRKKIEKIQLNTITKSVGTIKKKKKKLFSWL